MGNDGKLPAGITLPDGAVIGKEIFTPATGPLELYTIKKKNSTSPLAGSGYEWSEFTPDGNVTFSSVKKRKCMHIPPFRKSES